MSDCKYGSTATVHFNGNLALKVYNEDICPQHRKREVEKLSLLWELGFPVPRLVKTLSKEEGLITAIVVEKIEGVHPSQLSQEEYAKCFSILEGYVMLALLEGVDIQDVLDTEGNWVMNPRTKRPIILDVGD